MKLDYDFLSRMSRRLGGSFYVFDPETFVGNFISLQRCLHSYTPDARIAYALKSNYLPAICDLLSKMGGWAEVVSRLEFDIACTSLPTSRIVYNGPVKTEDDLIIALQGGSQLNVDSFHELSLLKNISGSFSDMPIGLRVCFPSPGAASRFGFDVASGELDQAIDEVSKIHAARLVALHCHATRRDLGVQSHVNRIRDLCLLADKLRSRHPIDTINIGGGILGDMPVALANQFPFPSPSVLESAHAIGEAFIRYRPAPGISLMIEPGTALAANAMCLAVKVIEVRKRSDGYQALLDSSINSVNPTRSKIQPSVNIVSNLDNAAQTYRLVGHTCMEHDILVDSIQAALRPGDFVVFNNRGAYSLNFTPHFIHPLPAVVDKHGNILKEPDDASSVTQTHRHYNSAISEGIINEYHADVRRQA
ncbi:hypothetical protein LG302_11445 [Halomonas organivorans]